MPWWSATSGPISPVRHDRSGECRKFAQDHDIPIYQLRQLCRAAEIQDLIQREIEVVIRQFCPFETIRSSS